MNFSSLVMQLSIWSILLPLLAGISSYKRLDPESRILFYLVILATLPQLLTSFMAHSKELNFIYNIYTPAEFLLTYLFIGNRMQVRIFRNISLTIVGLFLFLSVFIIIRYGLNHRFLNEWVCAANTCYLGWVLLYILESLQTEKKLLNTNLPMFWYISALLLYTPCTIFVFALSYYITKSQNPFINKLWNIQSVFNTLLYVFFAIGLLKAKLNFRETREFESSRPVQ
jgi:hypothetical protein